MKLVEFVETRLFSGIEGCSFVLQKDSVDYSTLYIGAIAQDKPTGICTTFDVIPEDFSIFGWKDGLCCVCFVSSIYRDAGLVVGFRAASELDEDAVGDFEDKSVFINRSDVGGLILFTYTTDEESAPSLSMNLYNPLMYCNWEERAFVVAPVENTGELRGRNLARVRWGVGGSAAFVQVAVDSKQNTAGFVDILYPEGPITAIVPADSELYVFKKNAVYMLKPIGGAQQFVPVKIADIGTLHMRSATKYQSGVAFAYEDNIYYVERAKVEPIGSQVFPYLIRNEGFTVEKLLWDVPRNVLMVFGTNHAWAYSEGAWTELSIDHNMYYTLSKDNEIIGVAVNSVQEGVDSLSVRFNRRRFGKDFYDCSDFESNWLSFEQEGRVLLVRTEINAFTPNSLDLGVRYFDGVEEWSSFDISYGITKLETPCNRTSPKFKIVLYPTAGARFSLGPVVGKVSQRRSRRL